MRGMRVDCEVLERTRPSTILENCKAAGNVDGAEFAVR
jgi:hypothetical protein